MYLIIGLCCLFEIADVCRFGSVSRCIFPCHCQSSDSCDSTTGRCDNGCQQDIQQGGPFSGPGCQIGKITDHCPLNNLQVTLEIQSLAQVVKYLGPLSSYHRVVHFVSVCIFLYINHYSYIVYVKFEDLWICMYVYLQNKHKIHYTYLCL